VNDSALTLSAITKHFGGIPALAGASLAVRRGTLHAVLGENGAGKTTLMRIAFGLEHADSGQLAIDGSLVALRSGADAIRHGLGMVHQHFTLVPAMTVAENVALGGRGAFDAQAVSQRIETLAARTGLTVDPAARVATLGIGAQQRVEILKALYSDARTLILDEPTAVLTPQESDELFVWLRRFVAEGRTVVLVTHKLAEALSVADDVTVLRHGTCVFAAAASKLNMETLVRALTGGGKGSTAAEPTIAAVRGSCIASLAAVTVRDAHGVLRIRDATMACFAGEVIGVAGVEGSGVHEFLRLLAGRLSATTGTVALPSVIGFIPEDRLRDALIEEFSLTENFALRGAARRTGRMRWPVLTAQTASVMRQHDVRAPSPAMRAGLLSGGNQQKFVLGRELDARPALVVAENPVRGLDLRATEHVARELTACAAAGSAVVVYSADIDELLPLAHRMFVVFAGAVREVPVERAAVAAALVGVA
jgi:simple sugar transport system ATP-binding protein